MASSMILINKLSALCIWLDSAPFVLYFGNLCDRLVQKRQVASWLVMAGHSVNLQMTPTQNLLLVVNLHVFFLFIKQWKLLELVERSLRPA
jgi:hypothetical protein